MFDECVPEMSASPRLGVTNEENPLGGRALRGDVVTARRSGAVGGETAGPGVLGKHRD